MELQGPRAKLERAFSQLKFLDDRVREFLDAKPFRVVPEFDDDSGSHILRLRSSVDEGTSVRWGLVVGEIVHNARSALDQTMWLVACRSNPVEMLWEDEIGRKIEFPLVRRKKRFPGHKVMSFIADDAKALLKGLQPYNRGDTPEALGKLDRLWNIDKHRVLHNCVMRLDLSAVAFRPKAIHPESMLGEFPITTWHPLPERMKDGTPVASIRFKDGAGPPYTGVDVNSHPSALIAFGSGFFALPIGGIGALLVQADHALSLFEGLPEEAPLSQAAKKRASTEKGQA